MILVIDYNLKELKIAAFSGKDGAAPSPSFIKNIEDQLKVPVTLIGTGPDVYDIIDRRQ